VVRSLAFVIALAGCGRIDFDATPTDARTGSDGDGATARLILAAGAGNASVEAVALADDDSLVMLGIFTDTLALGGSSLVSLASQNDLYVAALDGSDSAQWSWSAGCTTVCTAQGVSWLAGGGAVGGGYFGGTLTNGGGLMSGSGQDALVVWLTATGQLDVARGYGGQRNVQIRGLDRNGGVIAAGGLYQDTVDFGLGALPGTGTFDNGFVVLLDAATRMPIAQRAITAPGDVYVNDVAATPDGGVCIVGRFNAQADFGGGIVTPNSNDGFVVRYDAMGNFVWHEFSSGNGSEAASYVTATDDGDCVVSGYYTGDVAWAPGVIGAGGDDAFVARFDAADGTLRWFHALAGPLTDGVTGIASQGSDRVVVAGTFGATARLIDRDVTSEGAQDGFVFVLDGAGTPLAFQQLGGSGSVSGSLGGAAYAPSAARVAVGVVFTGELVPTGLGLTATASGDDGAVLILDAP
jgi:hypothetical protein